MSFVDYVRQKEVRLFPEFSSANVYTDSGYAYFAPSWHFGAGLLTEEKVGDMKAKAQRLLSIGAGRAYLERFLTDAMGMKSDQITLSDAANVMPTSFQQFVFNMYETWPDFGTAFDTVIFPESVFTLNFRTQEEKVNALYGLACKSMNTTGETGEMRVSGPFRGDEVLVKVRDKLRESHGNAELNYADKLIVVSKGFPTGRSGTA